MRNFASPLNAPTFHGDLPNYPVHLQLIRVTATTVAGPSGVAQVAGSSVLAPILYVAFTQQLRDDGSLLPRDREPCLADDVNGGGLTPGFYLGRLSGSWTSLPIYEVIPGSGGGSGGVGPQGPQGPAGPAGSKGDPGTQGTQGAPGATGSTGNPGTQGTPGAQGAAGPAGATGSTGNPGTQGSPGATGSTGSPGTQGSPGPTGSRGNPGTQGTTGATGPQGPTGATGSTGNPGTQGSQGPIGPAGPVGSPASALTVEEVDLSPSFTDVVKLRFNSSDGFVVTQPSANVVRIDLVLAGIIWNETPTGAINGSNTAFTLANTPLDTDSVLLTLNGVRLKPGAGEDYTISGTSITMAVAPVSGDLLLAAYRGGAGGGGGAGVAAGGKDETYWRQVGTSPLERWYPGGLVNVMSSPGGQAFTLNTLFAVPFISTRAGNLDRIGFRLVSGQASAKGRVGIYEATSETNLYPNALVVDGGEKDISGAAGVQSSTISQALTAGKLYWFVYLTNNSSATIMGWTGMVGGFTAVFGCDNTLGLNGANGVGLSVAQTYGTLPSTFPSSGTVMDGADATKKFPLVAVRYSG